MSVSEDEIDRLVRVYRSYSKSEPVRARWDDRNPGNRAIAAERRTATLRLLKEYGFIPLGRQRILEIGCGSGKILAELRGMGASPERLFGIDLLPDRISEARARNPGVAIECANAERLPFRDGEFDLVAAVTVFSSILDATMSSRAATELVRLLRPGGAVLWYDFRYRNPTNPNVRGMSARRIRGFFPQLLIHLEPISLLPPLARRLGHLTPVLYPLLARTPPFRGHYIGLLRKPAR